MNPAKTPEQIPVPSYMVAGARFYHATRKEHADDILANGIDRNRQGNVNALGPGFYTVENLANVWKWMLYDDITLEKLDRDAKKKNLSEKFSIVRIELVAVPTQVWDGPDAAAEVVVAQTDVVWTRNAIVSQLVRVDGQITGADMLANPSFNTWFGDNFEEEGKM
ncbi:hypothetical protein AA313_de0209892 [Arthrobotrys entomopaga]|nr:hypothetical protein AA313_de0209892 [Arthrobotrys entomopaga]